SHPDDRAPKDLVPFIKKIFQSVNVAADPEMIRQGIDDAMSPSSSTALDARHELRTQATKAQSAFYNAEPRRPLRTGSSETREPEISGLEFLRMTTREDDFLYKSAARLARSLDPNTL